MPPAAAPPGWCVASPSLPWPCSLWINNCVGLYNHKFFFLFVLYSWLSFAGLFSLFLYRWCVRCATRPSDRPTDRPVIRLNGHTTGHCASSCPFAPATPRSVVGRPHRRRYRAIFCDGANDDMPTRDMVVLIISTVLIFGASRFRIGRIDRGRRPRSHSSRHDGLPVAICRLCRSISV